MIASSQSPPFLRGYSPLSDRTLDWNTHRLMELARAIVEGQGRKQVIQEIKGFLQFVLSESIIPRNTQRTTAVHLSYPDHTYVFDYIRK